MMRPETVSVATLMSLYESTPHMVLYDKDLGTKNPQMEDMLRKYGSRLNPLDVVLNSVISRVAESLAEESLAPSQDIALVNVRFRDMAIRAVLLKAEGEGDFLTRLHDRWLSDFKAALVSLVSMEHVTVDEAIYRLAMKFRISAASTAKAIHSVLNAA